MYFFKFGSETMCVDATRDDGSLGRLVNDGVNGSDNCSMRMVAKEGKPYLALFASRNIGIGEELRYDYGVTDLPWRTSDKPSKAGPPKARIHATDIILDAEVGAIMTQPSNGSAEPHPICLVINTTELSDIPSAEAQIPNDVRPGKDLDGSEYEMLDTNTPRDITQVDKTLLLAEEEIDIRENPKGSSTPVLTRQNRIQVDKIQSHPEPIIPLLPNEFRGNSVIQPDSAQIGEDTENTQEPRPKEYAELLPISPTIFMDQRLPISPTIFMDQRLHSDNLSLNLSESEYGMMKFELVLTLNHQQYNILNELE
ncbi:uncharacterized protein LOC135498309 [Lineus longissimus]|uniref:uncharacterized protein LOC135498309 n=1 Tax=Lineus longissimus TaxID=88925 RepID=UPI00315CC7CF